MKISLVVLLGFVSSASLFAQEKPKGASAITAALLELQNGVLIYTKGKTIPNPDATLTVSKDDFAALLMGGANLDAEIGNGKATVIGSTEKIKTLFNDLDTFDNMFNIVTP